MLSYLQRNPGGNAVVVGYIAPLIVQWVILGPHPKGADASGYMFLMFLLPIIAIISGILSYFIFKIGSNLTIDASLFYEPFSEKIVLLIFGLLTIFVIFLSGYYNAFDEFGLVAYSFLSVFPTVVLTRRWSFYKRLLWIVAFALIIVLILNLKPNNF